MIKNINRLSRLKKQLEKKYKASEKPYYMSYNIKDGKVISIAYRRKETDKLKSCNVATEGFKEAFLYLTGLSFYKEYTGASMDYMAIYDGRTDTLNIMTGEEVI